MSMLTASSTMHIPGDLWGNMWKFDLTNANPTNWKVAYGTALKLPLFTAVDSTGKRQPSPHGPK